MRLLLALCIVLFLSCRENKSKIKDWKQIDNVLVEVNKDLVANDQQTIEKYISQKKLQMQKSPTGLWYKILNNTKTAKARVGDIVTFAYRCELIDGTLCYSSDSLGNKTVKLGYQELESGLVEGLQMLGQGSEAIFILPPNLAFGLLGDDNRIPPRSILVYYVKLLNIQR